MSSDKTNQKSSVLIIGAGAAGMMCAALLGRGHADVLVVDRNEKTGKKIYITGKGRCNFTNASGPQEFLENIVSNRKFMYSAAYGFTSEDTIRFFENAGLRTKVERGNRAFPASDHSSDVIRALNNEMKRNGVRVRLHTRIAGICTAETSEAQDSQSSGTVTGVITEEGEFLASDIVVIATGGLSYPSTGSTGDGFLFAKELGLAVTDLYPSLVGLTIAEREMALELAGLSLKNVELSVFDGKKECYSGFGEMLFTHTGISGPLVLTASAKLVKKMEGYEAAGKRRQKEDRQSCGKERTFRAYIDLKPALSEEQLDARILREFEKSRNKQFHNAVAPLFPAKLVPVIVRISGIAPDRKVNEVTRKERESFVRLVKHFPLTVSGHGGFSEAVITQGGIRTSCIDPHTMRVKKYDNLYAVGEVLDVDALTGGFNLQIAWSTAALAAEDILKTGDASLSSFGEK